MATTNSPASLGLKKVFRESVLPINIIFLEGATMPTVATAVMYYNGEIQEDVEIPVTIDGDLISFVVTVEQLRAAALQRKPYLYVLFDGDYRMGDALNISMDVDVYDPDDVYISLTGIGDIRVNFAGDYEAIREQANRAEAAAELAGEYKDLIIALGSSGTRRLGNWNASTNTPTLSPTVPPVGEYYDVSVAATSSAPTGSPVAYTVGQVLISTGTVWEVRPGTFIPADGSVTQAKMIERIANLFNELPSDSQFAWMILDEMDRIGLAIRKDGFVQGKFELQNGAVTLESISAAVAKLIFKSFNNDNSEFIFLLLDEMNRIGFGLKKDGTLIAKVELPDSSISEFKLDEDLLDKFPTDAFNRLNETNPNVVEIEDGQLWRGNRVGVPAKTLPDTGYGYQQFPNVKVKALTGLNDTGTDLIFRQTAGLPIRGRYYRGTFDPTTSGIVGTNYRGIYGNNHGGADIYPAFPAGSTGDCWVIHVGNTTSTKTKFGKTFKNGDMLVKTGGGHEIQPGPGDGTYGDRPGEFWNVTASGFFGGKYYKTGERIYYVGLRSESGPKYILYAPSKPGELYLMGECNGAFAPASQRDGDLYIFSANATAQGIAGLIGDMLVYQGGWGLLTGQIVNTASGKSFHLPCQNADEWAVRRADKSNTEVTVKAFGNVTKVRTKPVNEMALYSDSMFGVNDVGAKVLNLSGRSGDVHSFGGGTSRDILSAMRHDVLSSDPYAGRLHVVWHGTNNVADLEHVEECAWEMTSLVGSAEKRIIFWTPIGSRSVTHNGTRFVCTDQEAAFAGTGNEYAVEQMYEKGFKHQYFNTRLALLSAAADSTETDIQFPSLTEAQVATTYGIAPLSYWFELLTKEFTQAQMVYQGTRSTAGLPSGGTLYDYYNRTANGTVGNIIIKISSGWIEYTIDNTHLTHKGAVAIAAKYNQFQTALNI